MALCLIIGVQFACAAASPEYIGEERAKTIVCEHAGVTEGQFNFLELERYNKHGQTLYDIEFMSGGAKYSYKINARSGEIISYHTKKQGGAGHLASQPGFDRRIGEAGAKAIALSHAGVPEASVREYEIELDMERGRLVYEIEFETDGRAEYEYEIDALNGDILRCKFD